MGHGGPASVCTLTPPDSKSRLLPQLSATQKRATHLPHPALSRRASRTYCAIPVVGRGGGGDLFGFPQAAAHALWCARPPSPGRRALLRCPAPGAVRIGISGGLCSEMSAGQLGMESPVLRARCPVQEQRARWERKRACTARELLETERRYQEQLGLVATVRVPLALSCGARTPGCGRVSARSVITSPGSERVVLPCPPAFRGWGDFYRFHLRLGVCLHLQTR